MAPLTLGSGADGSAPTIEGKIELRLSVRSPRLASSWGAFEGTTHVWAKLPLD